MYLTLDDFVQLGLLILAVIKIVYEITKKH